MTVSEGMLEQLVARAQGAKRLAYAPYSSYPVGAALLGISGEIYSGANVENAAYSATMCAERSAIFSAVSAGEREFQALAVVTDNGGMPCGACRQVLSEFGPDTAIVIADNDGAVIRQITVRELLPEAFGPSDLDHS